MGQTPDNSPDDFGFRRVSTFSGDGKKNARYVIDDTTWNDLDMDKFYTLINSTHTSMGDEVLYSLLRTPPVRQGEHGGQAPAHPVLGRGSEIRESVQMQLARFGKYRDKGASTLMETPNISNSGQVIGLNCLPSFRFSPCL